MTQIDVSCALCGSRERTLRFREGDYSVVRCSSCDLTYVTPRLEEAALLERVYGEDYWRSSEPQTRGYGDYRGDEALYLKTFEKRLGLLGDFLERRGKVLDVGCAAGYFLRVMRERGWDVHGHEPSEPIHRTAAEALGPERVRGGRLEDAGFADASFDLITLWDVLEHAPAPVETLATCARLLKADGRLLVETQDVSSLAARLLGRRWQHYKHAEHLFHFHAGTLERALNLAGLKSLRRTARYGGKYVSPAFIAERSGRLHPLFARLLAPLARSLSGGVYVNPYDELIAIAAKWTPTPTRSS